MVGRLEVPVRREAGASLKKKAAGSARKTGDNKEKRRPTRTKVGDRGSGEKSRGQKSSMRSMPNIGTVEKKTVGEKEGRR